MLWSQGVELNLNSYSNHHRDCYVLHSCFPNWHITEVHVAPRLENRYRVWNLLIHLIKSFSSLWLCIGDFNELLTSKEKLGGSSRNLRQIKDFKKTLQQSELIDLGNQWQFLKWRRHHFFADAIDERLDKALVNDLWLNTYLRTILWHLLTYMHSDHRPILLQLCNDQPSSKWFWFRRYEKWWQTL